MSGALIDAVAARDIHLLGRLLTAGEDPNAPRPAGYALPPLQEAVAALEPIPGVKPAGSIDAVVLLLRHRADVNAWDTGHTTTALLRAVRMSHLECARLLLAAKADTNARGAEGKTPLDLAVENGAFEIARLLLRCGVDLHPAGGAAGMSALGIAATRLDLDMVKLLLAHGADPNAPDPDRLTPRERLGRLAMPEEPAAQERLREIRRLVGAA